jgi:hypothetical protein
MPFYTRSVADQYPERGRPPSAEHFIVLSGEYQVGAFHRIADGPSEGRWWWGAGLGVATTDFVATGYATSPEQCRILIARAFRAMLTHADLRERPEARPGSPRRKAIARPSRPTQPFDRENDRQLSNERRITVRSGSLIVGVLTQGPESWSWALTGVLQPDEDFIWRGEAETQTKAFNAIAAVWSQWVYWAGLESTAPLARR